MSIDCALFLALVAQGPGAALQLWLKVKLVRAPPERSSITGTARGIRISAWILRDPQMMARTSDGASGMIRIPGKIFHPWKIGYIARRWWISSGSMKWRRRRAPRQKSRKLVYGVVRSNRSAFPLLDTNVDVFFVE